MAAKRKSYDICWIYFVQWANFLWELPRVKKVQLNKTYLLNKIMQCRCKMKKGLEAFNFENVFAEGCHLFEQLNSRRYKKRNIKVCVSKKKFRKS